MCFIDMNQFTVGQTVHMYGNTFKETLHKTNLYKRNMSHRSQDCPWVSKPGHCEDKGKVVHLRYPDQRIPPAKLYWTLQYTSSDVIQPGCHIRIMARLNGTYWESTHPQYQDQLGQDFGHWIQFSQNPGFHPPSCVGLSNTQVQM